MQGFLPTFGYFHNSFWCLSFLFENHFLLDGFMVSLVYCTWNRELKRPLLFLFSRVLRVLQCSNSGSLHRVSLYTYQPLLSFFQVWDFESIDTAEAMDEAKIFEMEPMSELKVCYKRPSGYSAKDFELISIFICLCECLYDWVRLLKPRLALTLG